MTGNQATTPLYTRRGLVEDGKLKKLKYNPLGETSKFEVDTLRKSVGTAIDLESASTPDYAGILLGDPAAFEAIRDTNGRVLRDAFSPQEVQQIKDNFSGYVVKEHTGFGRARAKELGDFVWNASIPGLVDFVLSQPVFSGNSDPNYNKAAKPVREAGETVRSIRDDPEKFLAEHTNTFGPAEQAFYAPFGEKILGDFDADARETATQTMAAFGPGKFVKTNIEHGYATAATQVGNLQKVDTDLRAELSSIGNDPSDTAIEAKQKALEKAKQINKEHKDALRKAPSMALDLVRTTYSHLPPEEQPQS